VDSTQNEQQTDRYRVACAELSMYLPSAIARGVGGNDQFFPDRDGSMADNLKKYDLLMAAK
jgi:hypothetical protein